MVIVAQDVDAPAFDNAGRRSVIHLRTGNILRLIKDVDGYNVLCSSGWLQSRFFLVVPASLLRVAQGLSKRQPQSFVNFLRKFKPEEVTEPGEGKGEDEDEIVSPEEAESAAAYAGAPASFAIIPGDIPPESFKEIFKGYNYEHLTPDRRFLMTSVPLKSNEIIRNLKKKDPKTGRLVTERGVVRYRDPDTGKELSMKQMEGMQTTPAPEWVGLYQVLDTKTGETFAAESPEDAHRQVEHRLQHEKDVAAPEFVPYNYFVIQKVVDPDTKALSFSVKGDEKSPNLNPSPLESRQDAERYIDDNYEQLAAKVMG